MSWYRLQLRADQTMHLGSGRGPGFSATTLPYVPAPTLRGALCASWWRDHHSATQERFDALLAATSFSDAVASGPDGQPLPRTVPLDRKVCKYAGPECPPQLPWAARTCEACGAAVEPSKGQRRAPTRNAIVTNTRVALSSNEQALEDHLYEREGLALGEIPLVAMAAIKDGGSDELLRSGTVLRLGGSTSVAGRAEVVGVKAFEPALLRLPAGTHQLRLELLTPGVYVDEFGMPQASPDLRDLRWSLGLPENAQLRLLRSFIRWTTSGGWHRAANVPKPADAAVVAHSCFHFEFTAAEAVEVPSLVCDLGLRTTEGCGWVEVGELGRDSDAQ